MSMKAVSKRTDSGLCEFALIETERHEAEMDLLARERELRDCGWGSFGQCWGRFMAATERWQRAVNACWRHRSSCSACSTSC